jgi:2-polyprenyl-3-methyl-5-hydroxy-6-metoxy-1,4-benzoquinol methylase
VEPLTFEGVKPYYDGKNIEFINEIYEDCDSPTVDEIWFLNVLQHVKNPDHLIEKAKKHSKVIKFFEPINTEINNEHPFSFSEEDYKYYFGDSVKLYTPNDVNFHNAFCVYGIYKCEE